MTNSYCCGQLSTCITNQTIESENYVIGSPLNASVERFYISYNKEVKFMPRHIGKKFPNLKELRMTSCGLVVVRDYYFKNMANVQFLGVYDNNIESIKPDAFRYLISVKTLLLAKNKIETLDEKIFVTMVNLQELYVNHNRIKFLSPTTFNIPGGNLEKVYLEGNICIHRWYNSKIMDQLEPDLRANCTR